MDGLEAKSPSATTLSISGMTCDGCASTVARILTRVPGVESARVDFANGRAVVAGSARPGDLIGAVEAAGYGAQVSDSTNSGERNERGRSGGC